MKAIRRGSLLRFAMLSALAACLWAGRAGAQGRDTTAVGPMASLGVKGTEPGQEVANWANLKQLSAGQEIQVVLNDAKSYRGRFESVSQDTLMMRLETGEQSFDRKSLLRVSAKAGSHRLRNAALGGLIGIGTGAGIGAAAGKSSKGIRRTSSLSSSLAYAAA